MTTTFPPLPWEEGKTFVNDTTGVTYTFSDGKWLASGGPQVEGEYLPLAGGKLEKPGNLTVEGQMKCTGSEFKVQYPDDTSMLRVQPNQNNITLKAGTINTQGTEGSLSGRAGVEIQCAADKPLAISNPGTYQETFAIYKYDANEPNNRGKVLGITAAGNINTDGNVNAKDFVKGSEIRSTKLTSGQSSNLQIYRGSGANEDRKILVGTDSVNFDVSIKLVGATVDGKVNKDIQVLNGTKLFVSDEGGEIITFGGSGAFYRGAISQPDHLVSKEYVDDAIGNIDIPDVDLSGYLPLTGGTLSGKLTSTVSSGEAITINNGAVKFWASGAVATTYTSFKNDELVTKEYVDNKVAAGGSSFTPGEQVAKLNGSAGVAVGGFYIQNGNVFCKIS